MDKNFKKLVRVQDSGISQPARRKPPKSIDKRTGPRIPPPIQTTNYQDTQSHK